MISSRPLETRPGIAVLGVGLAENVNSFELLFWNRSVHSAPLYIGNT